MPLLLRDRSDRRARLQAALDQLALERLIVLAPADPAGRDSLVHDVHFALRAHFHDREHAHPILLIASATGKMGLEATLTVSQALKTELHVVVPPTPTLRCVVVCKLTGGQLSALVATASEMAFRQMTSEPISLPASKPTDFTSLLKRRGPSTMASIWPAPWLRPRPCRQRRSSRLTAATRRLRRSRSFPSRSRRAFQLWRARRTTQPARSPMLQTFHVDRTPAACRPTRRSGVDG